MEWLKFILIVVILATSSLFTFWPRKTDRGGTVPQFRLNGMIIGILLLLGAILLILSCGTVDSGHRGVVRSFKAVTERTLGEGLYFVTPFVQDVVEMNVQTTAYHTPAAAASKDLQDVSTEVTLNYRLNPSEVNQTFQSLRKDYEIRIVAPAIQESVKAVTAGYNAEELITRRPEVKLAIEDALQERLDKHGIILDTLSITNFDFSPAFNAAIEAKQVAQQEAIQAERILQRITVEAQQAEASATGRKHAAIREAEGQKQATVLRAEGDAKAIQLRAIAQAEANDLLAASLTEPLIRYTAVQAIAPGIRTIILPSGEQFILGPEILGGD